MLKGNCHIHITVTSQSVVPCATNASQTSDSADFAVHDTRTDVATRPSGKQPKVKHFKIIYIISGL